ncbi:MAG: cytidine deaminase [Thermoleophilia bacterium]|jgi:cytidine deaminase|nr:cytidine deaminase [Thermoleophilia bacterium]
MTRDALLAAAAGAAERAHAPYSGVRVGAAIEDVHGGLHLGANVECASHALSICAERAALARAVGDGATTFRAIAVVRADGVPITPCGACRQSLAEFGTGLEVVYRGPGGVVARPLAELIPDVFTLP